jgi:hypothetical protein
MMANINTMFQFFDHVERIIGIIARDEEDKKILDSFFYRVLRVCDGLEGPDIKWIGIALVARADLPEDVNEINDEFLSEAWLNR